MNKEKKTNERQSLYLLNINDKKPNHNQSLLWNHLILGNYSNYLLRSKALGLSRASNAHQDDLQLYRTALSWPQSSAQKCSSLITNICAHLVQKQSWLVELEMIFLWKLWTSCRNKMGVISCCFGMSEIQQENGPKTNKKKSSSSQRFDQKSKVKMVSRPQYYLTSSSDEMLTEDEDWEDDILGPSNVPVESQSMPALLQ